MFKNMVQASANDFKSICEKELWEYEWKIKRKHFLGIVIRRFQLILCDTWLGQIYARQRQQWCSVCQSCE
jgi:hypothetical protein